MLPLPDPSNPEPLVIQVLREYRARMDGMETMLMEDMGRRWLEIERMLDADIAALAYEFERRAKAGETITQQMVWKSEWYKLLKARMRDEIAKFNIDAANQAAAAQTQYATLGIEAAQNAILASYNGAGALSAAWTRINIEAVQAMIGLAGDGSPLLALLKKDYGDAADGLLDALIQGLARGLGPAQIAENMRDGFGMGLDRALLIARTEAARAYRTGSAEQYRKSGVVTQFMRLAKKATACAACLFRDGEIVEIGEELSDHPRGKAELPDNLIITDAPTALETFYHDGDIFVINTASGKFLPVTANHPVLTRRGWVAAAFIQKGDDVISYGGDNWTSGIMAPNKNHMPTRAQDLASTFNMFRLGRVPETAKYLYGDGEGSQIDVVYLNRFLWNSFDATRQKKVRQHFFGRPAIGLRSFDAKSFFEKKFTALFDAFLGIDGALNSGLSFCAAHSRVTQGASLGHAAPRNSTLSQYASNYIPRDFTLLGEILFRVSHPVHSANRHDVDGRKDDFILGASGQFLGLNRRSFGFVPEQPLSLEQINQGLAASVPLSGGGLCAVPGNIIFDIFFETSKELRKMLGKAGPFFKKEHKKHKFLKRYERRK